MSKVDELLNGIEYIIKVCKTTNVAERHYMSVLNAIKQTLQALTSNEALFNEAEGLFTHMGDLNYDQSSNLLRLHDIFEKMQSQLGIRVMNNE